MHGHTNGGDSRHNLSQFQFVENRRFTGGIQTDHQNVSIAAGSELLKCVLNHFVKEISHSVLKQWSNCQVTQVE